MSSEALQVEEALSRTEQRASPLYAGRVEVYAKAIKGQFRTIKWVALIVLLGIYYLTPWLRWDRGPGAPNQAVLADMAGGRLYFSRTSHSGIQLPSLWAGRIASCRPTPLFGTAFTKR